MIWQRIEPDNIGAELREQFDVPAVLLAGTRGIDRLSSQVGQLTLDDAIAGLPDKCAHSPRLAYRSIRVTSNGSRDAVERNRRESTCAHPEEAAMLWRSSVKDFKLALGTIVVVLALVAVRWVLFELGVEGMPLTALASSIIAGGVFVMGLVIAGTLGDYKDAERAPTELAASLYSILRETESMNRVWGKPDLPRIRNRLIAVVDALRRDINAGNSRECQEAIEELSESFIELEETDVPANYVVRLRQEQAALRKSSLRIYHIQREEFLPSAYAMIVSFVVLIVALLMFTEIESQVVTLVTLGFLSFFFLYLLRLLNVINKPFKVGQERGDDDVSLFLLYEFVVHARYADADLTSEQVVEIAERVEEVETTADDSEAGGAEEGEPVELDELLADAVEEGDIPVDVPQGDGSAPRPDGTRH